MTASEEFGDVRQHFAGNFSPRCWDSPPCVVYLLGCLDFQALKNHTRTRPRGVAAEHALTKLRSSGRASTQAVFENSFVQNVLADDARSLICRRISVLAQLDLAWLDADGGFALVRQLAPRTAFQVWRTWTNAWPTSWRFHDDEKLPCLAGCPSGQGSDILQHYLECPRLWFVIKICTNGPPPGDRRDKLGFGAAARHALLQLAVACSVYLVLKRDGSVRCAALEAVSSRQLRPLLQLMKGAATAAAHAHGGGNFARTA